MNSNRFDMVDKNLYLGIDQGGSSSKGVLLEENGQVYWEGSIPIQTFSEDGIVEHDPIEIRDSVLELIAGAKSAAGFRQIKSIGLSIQRSGVLAWELKSQRGAKSIKALTKVRTWRDSRTKDVIETLREKEEQIKNISGLPLTYHFAAAKLGFLQREFPESYVGTLDSWLLASLCDQPDFLTEESHAARTQLFGLKDRAWSAELCKLFGVELGRLAKVKYSVANWGYIEGIPVRGVIGDQQAALFGLQVTEPIINLGTLGQIICNLDEHPQFLKGYNSAITWSDEKGKARYQLEASINCCGEILNLVAGQTEGLEKIKEAGGVYFYPGTNTGSPDWRVDLVPTKEGADPETPLINRALLENVAFWVALNLRNLVKSGVMKSLSSPIYILGGGSNINYLVQAISSTSGSELRRLRHFHGSAYGAAALGFYATNRRFVSSTLTEEHDLFKPERGAINLREKRWLELYTQALQKV